MSKKIKIISGGQTGVDQAALNAARDCDLQIGGWCPPGRVSESGIIPANFPLIETPEDRSPLAPDISRSLRTEWNVRDADATLILHSGEFKDKGTKWTIECSVRFRKPYLICNINAEDAADKIKQWIKNNSISTLNIAGPSEETVPGIGEIAYELLTRIFI